MIPSLQVAIACEMQASETMNGEDGCLDHMSANTLNNGIRKASRYVGRYKKDRAID